MYYEQVLAETPFVNSVHKVVVSLSGGLDSTTLLHLMVKKYGKDNVYAISFNYAQRHDVELVCAKETTKKLGVYHKIIDISFLGDIVKGVSAMVKGEVATPTLNDLEAHKTVPTYVPFRNAILSSIVLSYAESVGADAVALGVQFGDYAEVNEKGESIYRYWDCSEDFTKAMQALADLNDKHSIKYLAPFVSLKKEDEIRIGQELGVDYASSWTCYNPSVVETKLEFESEPAGGRNPVYMNHYKPCGICPSCEGRKKAFKAVGIVDPLDNSGVWASTRNQ